MRSFILYSFFVLFFGTFTFGQNSDQKLAIYYFNQEQWNKAIPYFEKIYNQNHSDFIYSRYLTCLKSTGDNKAVLKLMKKQIAFFPSDMSYGVDLGKEYENQNEDKKAQEIYQNLIDKLQAMPSQIIKLQSAFSEIGKNQLALQTLQKGDKLLKGRYPLNIQFARVYGDLNQTDKMIQEYIDLLDYSPNMLSSLKQVLPRVIDFTDQSENSRYEIFRKELIRRIQKQPNNHAYAKLLIWTLAQQENFPAALVQAKSLSKRLNDGGQLVYKLGSQAAQSKDYTTARSAFKYVVGLGENQPLYYSAQQNLLHVGYLEITKEHNHSPEQVQQTIQSYQTALTFLPKDGRATPIIRQMAEIQAYYGNDAATAIKVLKQAITYPGVSQLETAKIKMLLADIYVVENKVWDASLLYMQIEEKFKYEAIGEEAKFKSARIFYFTGDFKYAQSQLDVLKEATTKLIANNALNLSAFITENLGLDSNLTAMKLFSKADLLLAQHQYSKAFQMYDSILQKFPNHKLGDDILMRKAKGLKEQGKWNESAKDLLEIVQKYPDGILADDALFQLANLYELQLNNHQKAKDYYFQLMKDYKGSVFVTQARKAYRAIE